MNVGESGIELFPDGGFGAKELAPDSEIYSGLQEPPNETELIEELENESEEASELQRGGAAVSTAQKTEAVRLNRLPVGSIKRIMKMDPSVNIASSEAVFLVTKATELFIETIAREAYSYTTKSKKKILSKKDLDTVIETVDALCFLDGALDF